VLQKNFKLALPKARDYEIEQKGIKLSFNIIFYHKNGSQIIKLPNIIFEVVK
jgi:hypothetical protein